MSATAAKPTTGAGQTGNKKVPGGAELGRDAGREARRVAAAILEVLAGTRTPTQAARALGVSVPRYYLLESRGLRGLLDACTPKPKGRVKSAASELAGVRRDNQRLQRELARQQALARAAQRALGLSAPAPPPARPGKKTRTRRPVARALTVARQLAEHDQQEPPPAGGRRARSGSFPSWGSGTVSRRSLETAAAALSLQRSSETARLILAGDARRLDAAQAAAWATGNTLGAVEREFSNDAEEALQMGRDTATTMARNVATEAAMSVAIPGAIRSFGSFGILKRALGPAGDGKVWHHIVEQRAANVTRFGAPAIHNTTNVVAISREANQAIANYYSSIPRSGFTGGRTVREWMNSKSYEEQYRFGLRILDAVLRGTALP